MRINLLEVKKEAALCDFHIDTDFVSKTPLIGVHHAHEWDHGYDSGTGYNGKRREFYADMREILSFLSEYIVRRSITEFIVAPFHRMNQFDIIDDENDIYREIKQFLKSYGIRGRSQAGVKMTAENSDVLEMILEGAFRGISELCILFPEARVLIAPNHHFDLPFFTNHINKEEEIIRSILKAFPHLKLYKKQYND